MIPTNSTARWRRPSVSTQTPNGPSADTFAITAEHLSAVREPVRWCLPWGEPRSTEDVVPVLRRALLGPTDPRWTPPAWLLSHQHDAARRVAGSLRAFGVTLLCDAVGLGKTYVALAVAQRYRSMSVVAPAVLAEQWRRAASGCDAQLEVVSHESLSRGRSVPAAELIVVDEAHRFRNPATRRYDRLARGVGRADVLLVTATPVVNAAHDLLHVLRIAAGDDAYAAFGLASLERAVATRPTHAVLAAVSPSVIGRSPATAGVGATEIPDATDRPVLAPSPLPLPDLRRLLDLASALRFPTFERRDAARLLALHLLHRVASSPAAGVECGRRHRAYLTRAIDAARRGERLTRGQSRWLFGPDDDLQLDLDLLGGPVLDRMSVFGLQREIDILDRVLAILAAARANPKLDALARILREREARKTVVFTTAIATAMDIAARLGWQRVAVVTGRGARIASGRISVDAALSLFAPTARGVAPPPARETARVLVATDLVSEGVNLQDADGVVHFDLPWTPLRLQQRVGRIARLGSPHSAVGVWWFVPPPPLEYRLDFRHRIETKADVQHALGVPVSSRVGRAQTVHGALEQRERSGLGPIADGRPKRPGHAVVVGPAIGVFALRWRVRRRWVPALIVAAEGQADWSLDATCRLLETLAVAPSSPHLPPPAVRDALHRAVRRRIATANTGPHDMGGRRLARRLARRAARALRDREVSDVSLWDRALQQLTDGVRHGGHRTLEVALADPTPAALRGWLRTWRAPTPEPTAVRVDAALIGDGTRSWSSTG